MELGICMHICLMATRWQKELSKHRQRPGLPGPAGAVCPTLRKPKSPALGQLVLLGELMWRETLTLSRVPRKRKQ